jgi:hypothetical protein
MARRGFLGRIVDRVRNIVAPSQPPREPPRQPPPPPEPPPRGPRDSYRGVWRKQHGSGSYRKNLEVFHGMIDDIEPDEAERIDLWNTYVRNVNRNRRGDPYRRQSMFNPFWQESGIDPSTMDWRRWRIAMGYTGKNRSKTT